MDITYIGHSCFKLKGKGASVIIDPYGNSVGFEFPRLSADVVVVSHGHPDHNNSKAVTGTARRNNPFLIDTPGEYEVNGVGVFGLKTYHDANKGEERGENIVHSILVDGVNVVHLGDLGHALSEAQVSALNDVDVLLCPVGGVYTITADQAMEVMNAVEPSIFVPMHFKTEKHDPKVFAELSDLDGFLKKLSKEPRRETKLSVTKQTLPEEMEVVVLEQAVS